MKSYKNKSQRKERIGKIIGNVMIAFIVLVYLWAFLSSILDFFKGDLSIIPGYGSRGQFYMDSAYDE